MFRSRAGLSGEIDDEKLGGISVAGVRPYLRPGFRPHRCIARWMIAAWRRRSLG
jgi:hypothetical protein